MYAAQLGPFILTNQTLPTNPAQLNKYTTCNYQVLSIIQTLVGSKHFQHVANSQAVREAYLAILAQYNNSGGLSTAMIFSELLSLPLHVDARYLNTSINSEHCTTSL